MSDDVSDDGARREHDGQVQRPDALYKLLVVLSLAVVVLGVLLVHASSRLRERGADPGTGVADIAAGALRDDERTAAEVAAMVAALEGPGLWDSHPDALIGHIGQPRMRDRDYHGVSVSTNSLGMREREYALPKPAGTLRVVLLGDSFIFGMGVEADERLGVHLERFLTERAGHPAGRLQVLHLGASSWSLLAECAYLRRQLSLLDPDLVLHVSVSNDLGDTMGARGFGAMARFVPAAPWQGDAMVRQGHARWALDRQANSLLPRGWDGESRDRFTAAGAALERLVGLLAERGTPYLHLFHWGHLNPTAAEQLAGRAGPDPVFLPEAFFRDGRYRISASDEHWNPAGHRRMALLLYALIVERGWLPGLALEPWEEADAVAAELVPVGRAEAGVPAPPPREVSPRWFVSELDPHRASQVHAGIDAEGRVQPYASLMLGCAGRRRLRIRGRALDLPELDGCVVRVRVDEVEVGQFILRADQPVREVLFLPGALVGREVVSVRFQADDFAYAGRDLRDTVSWMLEGLALEEP